MGKPWTTLKTSHDVIHCIVFEYPVNECLLHVYKLLIYIDGDGLVMTADRGLEKEEEKIQELAKKETTPRKKSSRCK